MVRKPGVDCVGLGEGYWSKPPPLIKPNQFLKAIVLLHACVNYILFVSYITMTTKMIASCLKANKVVIGITN